MRLEPEKKQRGPRTGHGGRRAAMPGFIKPCDPTLRDKPPEGSEWIYEIKSDGYRTQLHIRRGKATVYTRRGYDWTDRFAAIAAAAAAMDVREAIFDGEATVLASTGVSDFQALQNELHRRGSPRIVYHAFDLLYLDGEDWRDAPLEERKRALKRILDGAPENLIYHEHLEIEGSRVFEHACKLGLEGIIGKRRDAPYRSGRQDSWIKVKCAKSETFPIVAFVEKLGARPRRVASFYVGRRDGDRLLYAGKVQTGYTLEQAQALRERLDPLIVRRSPLSIPVKKPKATWVTPEVEAEIEFSAITEDGLLRAAVYKGLRDDLAEAPPPPAAKLAPRPAHVSPVNIMQLLPDAVAPTKEQLVAYWRKVAPKALVHLARRPLKLVRSAGGKIFYHKGPLPPVPDSVHQLKMQKREGGEGVRLWVDDLEGLLGLVEIGAVELHPWNATVDDIEMADRIVVDLDPGEGVEWPFVIETALALREIFGEEGLESWPKLTGSKGIHVMAPLAEAMPHDEARSYAKRLAQQLAIAAPEKYLTSSAPGARRRKIFLDYLRNGRGSTAVGAFSPRVRPGFPIAAPATWKQVEQGIRPDAFTMASPSKPRRSA